MIWWIDSYEEHSQREARNREKKKTAAVSNIRRPRGAVLDEVEKEMGTTISITIHLSLLYLSLEHKICKHRKREMDSFQS